MQPTVSTSVLVVLLLHISVAWTLSDLSSVATAAHAAAPWMLWPLTLIVHMTFYVIAWAVTLALFFGFVRVFRDDERQIDAPVAYVALFVNALGKIVTKARPWYHRVKFYAMRAYYLAQIRMLTLPDVLHADDFYVWRVLPNGKADPRNFVNDTVPPKTSFDHLPSAYLVRPLRWYLPYDVMGVETNSLAEYREAVDEGDVGVLTFTYGALSQEYAFPSSDSMLVPHYGAAEIKEYHSSFREKPKFCPRMVFKNRNGVTLCVFSDKTLEKALRMWAGPLEDFYESLAPVHLRDFAFWYLRTSALEEFAEQYLDDLEDIVVTLSSAHPRSREGDTVRVLIDDGSDESDCMEAWILRPMED